MGSASGQSKVLGAPAFYSLNLLELRVRSIVHHDRSRPFAIVLGSVWTKAGNRFKMSFTAGISILRSGSAHWDLFWIFKINVEFNF